MPPSMQESFRLNQEFDEEKDRDLLRDGNCNTSQRMDVIVVVESMKDPLIEKTQHKGSQNCLSLSRERYILLQLANYNKFPF